MNSTIRRPFAFAAIGLLSLGLAACATPNPPTPMEPDLIAQHPPEQPPVPPKVPLPSPPVPPTPAANYCPTLGKSKLFGPLINKADQIR